MVIETRLGMFVVRGGANNYSPKLVHGFPDRIERDEFSLKSGPCIAWPELGLPARYENKKHLECGGCYPTNNCIDGRSDYIH